MLHIFLQNLTNPACLYDCNCLFMAVECLIIAPRTDLITLSICNMVLAGHYKVRKKHMKKKQNDLVYAPNERSMPRNGSNMEGIERCCSQCLQWKPRLENFKKSEDDCYSLTCKVCEGIVEPSLTDGPIIARRRVNL